MPKQAPSPPPKAKAIGPYSMADREPAIWCSSPARSRSMRPPASWSRATSPPRPSSRSRTSRPSWTRPASTFAHVVKTTIFLTSMADFAAVNEVYKAYVARALPGALDHRRGGPADGRQGRDRNDRLAQRRSCNRCWHRPSRTSTQGHERPRVPGQGAAASVRRAGGAGRAGLHGGRGREGRAGAARARLGGEGADPRRRPRQGQVQGA